MERNIQTNGFLYGGDYNPEQWLERPDILEKDIQYFKEARINWVTLGVFSWSMLEPKEGEYHFEWLKKITDRLYQEGISFILATPSGARPHWLAKAYPDVLRINERREKELFGERHNHCASSENYRRKVREIDTKLAEEFGNHPGLLAWHISNEFGGECHCERCQNNFRKWLKNRYGTIEELNKAYNTRFWSHVYDDFDQVESPSSIGEIHIHGLNLDWKRFVSYETQDFMKAEIKALRDAGSQLPVTTNFMFDFGSLDYKRFAKDLDVISWDNYPTWHHKPEIHTALETGFQHDFMRTLKQGKPFMVMESCPSQVNWKAVRKLKKPGMLKAECLEAIAHGSDSIGYFQMRASYAGMEKYHGALIDQSGRNDTRVFKEAKEIGEMLVAIQEVKGTRIHSCVAILYDRENEWALRDIQGPRNEDLKYQQLCLKWYAALRKQGFDVDVISCLDDLSSYSIVILPMAYVFPEGYSEKVKTFVQKGGTLLATYGCALVNETDACYLGDTPHELTEVFGIRHEETDGLYDEEKNLVVPVKNNALAITQATYARTLCDLIHAQGAQVLMEYGEDFYKGYPAVTRNVYGNGKAYYAASDFDQEFLDAMAKILCNEANLTPVLDYIPEGILIHARYGSDAVYYFLQNFSKREIPLSLPKGWTCLYGDLKMPLKPLNGIVCKENL